MNIIEEIQKEFNGITERERDIILKIEELKQEVGKWMKKRLN